MSPGAALGRGVALRGTVWLGADAAPALDWVVVVDGAGQVAAAGPVGSVAVPEGVRGLGDATTWVGPGVVDAHVHLAFGEPAAELRGGLVGVRDLGAPLACARAWRTPAAVPAGTPYVAVVGPLLTAPGGYPSLSWGAEGFASFVESPAQARALVRSLAAEGVDLVKVALEPAGGAPVPSLEEVRAVVDSAHAAGLAVTAHALQGSMVHRALDAGVDELCHVPTERLGAADVARVAVAGVPVVSTIETLATADELSVTANAAALVAAGVPLVYGTDLGNAGTRPGVDGRELRRLADTGLGALGALRAATVGAAAAFGMRRRTGRIVVGEPAALVLLPGDPLVDVGVWSRPLAVLADAHLTLLT